MKLKGELRDHALFKCDCTPPSPEELSVLKARFLGTFPTSIQVESLEWIPDVRMLRKQLLGDSGKTPGVVPSDLTHCPPDEESSSSTRLLQPLQGTSVLLSREDLMLCHPVAGQCSPTRSKSLIISKLPTYFLA